MDENSTMNEFCLTANNNNNGNTLILQQERSTENDINMQSGENVSSPDWTAVVNIRKRRNVDVVDESDQRPSLA
jgi:hypothetical protein